MIRLKYHIINRSLYDLDTHQFMNITTLSNRYTQGEKIHAVDQDGNDITDFIIAKLVIKREREKVRESLRH